LLQPDTLHTATTKANVLWPSYKSAWVNQHLQLRTGEDFVGAKFYCLIALADGKQRIQVREKMPEFLLSVTCTIHTHPFNNPFSGTTQVSRYQEGKTNLDLLKQETVSGSGISWAVCIAYGPADPSLHLAPDR